MVTVLEGDVIRFEHRVSVTQISVVELDAVTVNTIRTFERLGHRVAVRFIRHVDRTAWGVELVILDLPRMVTT